MHWDNDWNHGSGAGWWLMAIMMIPFAVALVWAITTARRPSLPPLPPSQPAASPPIAIRPAPEDILRERLARGDINVDEYHARLDALRAKQPPSTG